MLVVRTFVAEIDSLRQVDKVGAYVGRSWRLHAYLEESFDLVLREVDLEVLHRGRHLAHVDSPALVGVPLIENPPDVVDDFSPPPPAWFRFGFLVSRSDQGTKNDVRQVREIAAF